MAHYRSWAAGGFAAVVFAAWGAAQTPVDPSGHPQNDPHPPIPTGPAGGTWPGPGDTVPGGGSGSGTLPGGQGGGTGAPPAGAPGAPAGSAPVPVPGGSTGGQPGPSGAISILDLGPDTATWEVWWSLNRDRFLAIKAALYAADATVAPEGTGLARRRPDARFVADRVVPVLIGVLERDEDPALLGEALLALARADLGRGIDDSVSARVIERLAAGLSHRQLAVAESAAMALGARGSSRSIPLLASLVEDSAAARAAVARAEVPMRLRSIAALSLGIAAARGRVDVQRYAAHALSRPLQARDAVPQELAASCAAALGLLDLGGGPAGDGDLPAAASTAALARFLAALADEPERDQIVRAQCAASAGRVAATGTEATRTAAIGWAVGAASDAARPAIVRQGAAIALGRLGRPTDAAADRAARAALAALVRDTDRLVRGLAWLARGEIGARARVEAEKAAALEIQAGLLADFETAKSGALGFVALALGVFVHDSALIAAADGNRVLKDSWPRARSPSETAAVGLALGLRLDVTSTPLLADRFPREGDPSARAALALGLGLAGSKSAVDALRAGSAPDNHPLVIRDSAIGRALLDDRTTGPEMVTLLGSTRSLLAADYAADALAAMGDGIVLESLVALAKDAQMPTGRRTRVVRALGAVADASQLPWNEPLRADGHVGAAFDAWRAVVLR